MKFKERIRKWSHETSLKQTWSTDDRQTRQAIAAIVSPMMPQIDFDIPENIQIVYSHKTKLANTVQNLVT